MTSVLTYILWQILWGTAGFGAGFWLVLAYRDRKGTW